MAGTRLTPLVLTALFSACAITGHDDSAPAPIECRLAPQVKSPDEKFFIGWGTPLSMDTATSSPEALKAEPAYRFGAPRYASVSLGDGGAGDPFVLVLDASPGLEKAPELCLYFDSNNNEDLTDDPVLGPAKPPTFDPGGDIPSARAVFQTAQADVVVDGQTVVRHLEFSFIRNVAVPSSRIADNVWMNIADYMAGTLEVGQQSFPVRIIDANKNGRFSDVCRIAVAPPAQPGSRREADSLVIGPLGNENRPGLWGGLDSRPLADYLCLGGRSYAWRIAPSGESMTLLPPDVPTGRLSFPLRDYRLSLLRGEGILVASGPGRATVPAGLYGPGSVSFQITDGQGDRWTLGCSLYNLQTTLNVEADRTLRCPFGPPLTAKIRTKELGGRRHMLTVELTGNGGERYDWGSGLTKNGEQVVPSVLVEDAKGREVLRGGAYQRGSDYIGDGYVWDVPADVRGRFKVTPVVDLGPVPVKVVPGELTIP